MPISDSQKALPSALAGRPEPAEILDGLDLSGKVAVVSGGYSGLGLETARALAAAGAEVYAPARDTGRAAEALAGVVPAERIGEMDLSDLQSVARYGEGLAEHLDRLDFLIANAGVMACPEMRTAQGLEYQMGVNHFGHFVLIDRLRARLAEGARIITLSSIGHRLGGVDFDDMNCEKGGYDKWKAYGRSKSAKALLAVELDRRLAEQGVRSFSVHPGGIFTPLQRHLDTEEMVKLGWMKEGGEPSEVAAKIFKTPAQGAGTTLWAATTPQLDGLGGVYCEDCDVANVAPDDDTNPMGVRGWAVDTEIAARLWEITEEMLAGL